MDRQELIVGCYTPGDYAKVAEDYLLKSVRALGLPHEVREVASHGSWVANGYACQEFLWAVCNEKPQTDLLFLDADAVVRSDPWPFLRGLDCDLAGHYFNGKELLTGTLYLPAGPRRLEILGLWMARNRVHKGRWDQQNLQHILEHDETIRVSRLPAEYCCIFDLQRKRTPGIIPVIEQFQASRRFRRRVK